MGSALVHAVASAVMLRNAQEGIDSSMCVCE